MSYTALYRKYRPITFNEIVGQEHITKTLKNQIVAGRVGHAYLFNGGRGTGKTSAAKVLARAVNCLNPKNGEPCNECEICKAAINGSLTDIVEMDAASNNSVEDIRAIRDEVNFLPTLAKYRVYIIDEVHMLSTGAFNALLKTLEEPPEHVKFILATTEPQKLPATILSRCQRFDFKKISNDKIYKRLDYICKQSNIDITEEALKTISILSEGAMRDALSILERCVQEGDIKIDDDKVKELVGIPKIEYVNKIVDSVINCDEESTLEAIDVVINDGKDLTNLLWEIIKYVKDVLVFKTTGKAELYNQNDLEKIKDIAQKATKQRLLKMIYDLSELENDIKWSTQKTIMLQVGIMKLCQKQEEKIIIQKPLENVVQVNNSVVKNVNSVQPENTINKIPNIEQVINKPAKNVENVGVKSKNSSFKNANGWVNIVNQLKQSGKIMLYTNLLNAEAKELNDLIIGIEFPNGLTPFGKTVLEKPENVNELNRLVSMEYGKPMQVKIIENNNSKQKKEENPLDNLANELDIPINIIEE